MKRIYLDYASITPIDKRVISEMKKYASTVYANPSSLYKEGVAAKNALEEGRKTVAEYINAHSDEIVFTGGGTEANNLALFGAFKAAKNIGIEKPHLIISSIEHSSIIETANAMEKQGIEVTRLRVDSNGIISLDELKKAIKLTTFLISIMTVNNEIGTIQPIREIAKVIRQDRARRRELSLPTPYPLFHTDAAQAFLQELNVERLGVDLLTLDGSKIYGPRGIGCLYIRRGTPIETIIYGGGQEDVMRSGTENIPAIMGFAKALGIVKLEQNNQSKRGKKTESARLAELKGEFISGLRNIRKDIVINGIKGESGYGDGNENKGRSSNANDHGLKISPHILNVSIPGVDNEYFVLQLDAVGIACSTKSSCLKDEEESYVLKAIGVDSKTSVRFSFGRWTKSSDIKAALKKIGQILQS